MTTIITDKLPHIDKGKSSMNYVDTASGTPTEYFSWHPGPPFWNDYIKWFHPKDALLDVGCGQGWLADHVANYTGIDSSQSAVSYARKKNRNVVHGSVEDTLPFEDKSFDAILLKDILEHLESPALVVSECKRVLRPGGKLAAFAPDAQRWAWDDYTHIRPFTRTGFRKLFEDQGFMIDNAAYEPLMHGVWYLTLLLKRNSRPSFLWKLAWLPKMKRNVMVVATMP